MCILYVCVCVCMCVCEKALTDGVTIHYFVIHGFIKGMKQEKWIIHSNTCNDTSVPKQKSALKGK